MSSTVHPASRAHSATAAFTPLAAEEHRMRKAHYKKKTVENLVAFGLVDSAPTDSRPKKRKKSVGFSFGVKEITCPPPSQQTQATPAHALNLDPFSSKRPGTEQASSARHSHPTSSTSKPSWWSPGHSRLKELHNDEMFATKGTSRRERTFVGSNCAACEEPLEHMLRGERILQLSCGHVSHEACFYEYIKEFEAQTCPDCNKPLGIDTSRGGNLDFSNLNKLVRNVQTPDLRDRPRDSEPVPQTPWSPDSNYHRPDSNYHRPSSQPLTSHRPSRDHLLPEQAQLSSNRYGERHDTSHTRNPSEETGRVSSNGYSEAPPTEGRKHDYDVHSMEASVNSPHFTMRNPIPAPIVTVRSEFPTLSKSRHQQSLTCLITVEVMEGKWHVHPDDLRSPPPLPSPIREELFETPTTPLMPSKKAVRPVDSVHEDMALEEAKEDLFRRVDNWHGLDFERFGRLILHGTMRVGKDRQTWQELDCYLFSEMLICVKEKKQSPNASQQWDGAEGPRPKSRYTLKGSILIKRHLDHVEASYEDDILTLKLSVAELPSFHLHFQQRRQLETWRNALININIPEPPVPRHHDSENEAYGTDEDDFARPDRRVSSVPSSYGGAKSQATAPTDHTSPRGLYDLRTGTSSMHIPLDIVVVIPVSSSMHGLKMNLLRDSLRFLVSSLGERDRLGLVSFGSGIGSMPLVGMTTKSWPGWSGVLDSIRPVSHKNLRADVVEGANVAMDLLMQRKSANPLANLILISDSPTSDPDSVDFLVSRAEAAKVGVYSFGLGLNHKPDTMVEMATRTKASYTYVKDWMMLRECLAGCIGGLQSISHQNVKVRLHLPEGSRAKFVKISGALQVTKRASGRDAEASLGDMRFGDKRDILVQLAIQPDNSTPDSVPSDPWENIISGLEALGPMDQDDQRTSSVEELPLIQADLKWGDILRNGNAAQLPRPSLLAITMLPPASKKASHTSFSAPPIPPHPSIVQRRMELLTSDMLSRALGLVTKNQNDRAHHLLAETRSILKGLGKGGLPPLPTPPPTTALPPTPRPGEQRPSPGLASPLESPFPRPPTRMPSSPAPPVDALSPFTPAAGIDRTTITALDSELESSLEWISHPVVFARDSRKAVLQAIGVISSQRGYTFRTPSESLWATRVPGIRRLAERSREWREYGDETLTEES